MRTELLSPRLESNIDRLAGLKRWRLVFMAGEWSSNFCVLARCNSASKRCGVTILRHNDKMMRKMVTVNIRLIDYFVLDDGFNDVFHRHDAHIVVEGVALAFVVHVMYNGLRRQQVRQQYQ